MVQGRAKGNKARERRTVKHLAGEHRGSRMDDRGLVPKLLLGKQHGLGTERLCKAKEKEPTQDQRFRVGGLVLLAGSNKGRRVGCGLKK